MVPNSLPPSKNKPQTSPILTTLNTAVQYIPRVGPFKSEILSKLNIKFIRDLLLHFPRDHQDRRIVSIDKIKPHTKVAIQAKISHGEIKRLGKLLGQARAVVEDESGQIELIWFKRLSFKFDVFSALRRHLQPNNEFYFYGQVVISKDNLAIRVEQYEPVASSLIPATHANGIVPIYPLTEGLTDKWLRELISRVVPQFVNQLDDPLPESIIQKGGLIPFSKAVSQFHHPGSWKEKDEARERLAFDEFFFLELALELTREKRTKDQKGYQSVPSRKKLTPFKNKLGYTFTKAQSRSIKEIFNDMEKPMPMNRLLQGDVGSGKTIVALSAALLAIENDRQVVLLAPTEILAEQHALSIAKIFENLNVSYSLLTRSTPTAEKKEIITNLKKGKIQLLIGTHSVLNDKVQFKNLGLVIIDEQHRFGVRQRARLIEKNSTSPSGTALDNLNPDVLIMTATPIPRTLALTLYGDLEVSVIDELPPGRSPIQTRMSSESDAIQKIQARVKRGEQVFLVLPLIEESQALTKKNGKTIKAAKVEFEKLKHRLPNLSIGLLHGQMPSEEKQNVLGRFRNKEISILVATPVIEVGIDIPNASLMVIMSPERFGLSQLHQLRGRVGRGKFESECLLIQSNDWEEKTLTRLEIFCRCLDGFELAEEDLKIRGPGEFIGEAQHGVPFFKVGSLILDQLIIAQAKEIARTLVNGEVSMTMKEFQKINSELQTRFGNKLKLSTIG